MSQVYVAGPNAFRDRGRKNTRFADFMGHQNVKEAELTPSHVAALRLYTTPAYKYINAPLRSQVRVAMVHTLFAPVSTPVFTQGSHLRSRTCGHTAAVCFRVLRSAMPRLRDSTIVQLAGPAHS